MCKKKTAFKSSLFLNVLKLMPELLHFERESGKNNSQKILERDFSGSPASLKRLDEQSNLYEKTDKIRLILRLIFEGRVR